jgi:hypothetical protein
VPATTINRRMHALLKRVLAAELASHFQLREVCPLDATKFEAAFERLQENGHTERVVVKCGQWYWRLTEKGLKAAAAKKPPRECQPAKLPGNPNAARHWCSKKKGKRK